LVRERSNIIWRFGRGFAQTARGPSYVGCGWEGFCQSVIKLLSWLKKLNIQHLLLYLRYMWGERGV